MITTDNKKAEYSDFWKHNLEKLEEIQNSISNKLLDLEKKYSDFEAGYTLIEEELNTLSSIYSSFNNIQGNEHLLKLNTIIERYRERYTRQGIDFELINFLLDKITSLRDKSFENFPVLDHEEQQDIIEKDFTINYDSIQYNRPFKWITFERNNSWFITEFNNISVKTSNSFKIISNNKKGIIEVEIDKEIYFAKDLMTKMRKEIIDPEYFIIIDNGLDIFAASKIGKTIFSKTDFLSSQVKPFTRPIKNKLFTGRLKIFGKNHIHLNIP